MVRTFNHCSVQRSYPKGCRFEFQDKTLLITSKNTTRLNTLLVTVTSWVMTFSHSQIDSVTKCLLVRQTLLSIPNPYESSCIWFWLMPDGLLTELRTPNSKPRLYHWPILWAITLVHLLISRFKGMSALLTHTCKNTPGDRWHQLKPIHGHLSLRGEEVSETIGDLLKAHITVITVYCHVRSS